MVLLDTCCLLWLASSPEKLSEGARKLISENAGSLFISAISAFEITIKHQKRRLLLPQKPMAWIQTALEFHGIQDVPVTWQIAGRSVLISLPHRDPCDRIIVATAELLSLTLVTPDPEMRRYSRIKVVW